MSKWEYYFPGDHDWGKMMSETKNGSQVFYALLERMSNIHSQKSHDYASNSNPYGNYQFAGKMSKLFDNPDDAGFMGRIAEKLFRLANLENGEKTPSNESIEDTEIDICVITALWMASRMERRGAAYVIKDESSHTEGKR